MNARLDLDTGDLRSLVRGLLLLEREGIRERMRLESELQQKVDERAKAIEAHLDISPMRLATLRNEVTQLVATLRARSDIGAATMRRVDAVERALAAVVPNEANTSNVKRVWDGR